MLGFVIVLLSGCASTENIYDRNTILPADRLVKKLESNRRKVKYFEGTGVLKINSAELVATSNFEVIVKKPDSIKISFYGPFGVDIAHVLIGKEEVKLYDVLQNNFYVSSKNNDFLYRLFKVNISFDELLNALIGSVDMTDRLLMEPDEYSAEGKYRLAYIDKLHAKKSIYFVDLKTLALTKYYIEKFNGEKLLEANYSDFSENNKLFLPNKIMLVNKTDSQTLEVDYRKIKLNSSQRNLKFSIPRSTNIIKLD